MLTTADARRTRKPPRRTARSAPRDARPNETPALRAAGGRAQRTTLPTKAWLRPALRRFVGGLVKLIVILVCGLYAWSFASQFVRTHYIDAPAPNPLAELWVLHDLTMRQMRDYTLWTSGHGSEETVQADAFAVREHTAALSSFVR